MKKFMQSHVLDFPHDIEVDQFTPGRPPTSIWLAMGHPEIEDAERSLVALVGVEESVSRFLKHAKIQGKRFILSPRPKPDAPKLMAVVLGTWPRTRARGVVELFNVPDSTTRAWGRTWRTHVANDRDLQPFVPSPELTSELCQIYLEQCLLALREPS